LFRWRQQLCLPPATPVFSAVAVAPEPGAASPPLPVPAGVIEIEFATGARMRITGPADASTVSALIRALAKTKRRR
jgi:transposase